MRGIVAGRVMRYIRDTRVVGRFVYRDSSARREECLAKDVPMMDE